MDQIGLVRSHSPQWLRLGATAALATFATFFLLRAVGIDVGWPRLLVPSNTDRSVMARELNPTPAARSGPETRALAPAVANRRRNRSAIAAALDSGESRLGARGSEARPRLGVPTPPPVRSPGSTSSSGAHAPAATSDPPPAPPAQGESGQTEPSPLLQEPTLPSLPLPELPSAPEVPQLPAEPETLVPPLPDLPAL